MNYTELAQAIQDTTQNTETSFVNDIPMFVRHAEEVIFRNVRIPELRKSVVGTLSSGDQYLQRPADFLAPFSIAVVDGEGDYTFLLDKDTNFMREAYPNPLTSGLPKYYAQFEGSDASGDGYFILGPTPDDDYAVELRYYYDPPSIVDSGTSWLGDNAETALLYGALIPAYIYMKGDADVLAMYRETFSAAMEALMRLDRMTRRDNYRDGEPRNGI